jgi:import inner membrane translocase subunit TIM8
MSEQQFQLPDLNLDEASQRELAQFIEQENAKARVQQSVHTLTDMCWDKCIGQIGSKLNGTEKSCLSNCVERFLDTSIFIVNRLKDSQQKF